MLTTSPVTIGFLLHDTARSIRHAFDQKARVLGVTRAQWRTLLFLARCDGATQTELADALDVERISAGRMVDRLVDAGLVERRADPADRRIWRLHLLPAAHAQVSALNAISQEIESQVLGMIPADRREEFVELLTGIRSGMRRIRDGSETRKDVA